MKTRLLLLAAALLATPAIAQESAAPPAPTNNPAPLRHVTIAVVRDGPCGYADELAGHIEQELHALAHGEFDVTFATNAEFDAGWDVARAPEALRRALADTNVNMVLTMGVLASAEASHGTNDLTKPVIGGFVLDADTLQLPYDKNGRSTKTNFSFVVTPLRSTRDLQAFHQLIGFQTVHCLVDAKLIQGLQSMRGSVTQFETNLGVGIRFIPAGVSAEETLAKFPTNVEALYLTPTLRMPEAEQAKLIAGINALKIPTFALIGYPAVERGALAGLAPDTMVRLARRIALNLQQVMLGTSPNDLTVNMAVDEKLVINGRTAVQVGYYPDFDTLLRADVLFADAFERGDPLALADAMKLALKNNIDLDIERAQVRASEEDRVKARSGLLPQVRGQASSYEIDKDRAEQSAGIQPQDRTAAGIGLTQVLFDDGVWSQLHTAGLGVERQRFEEEARTLDVLATAGKRFLQYLSTRALYRIDVDNLKLTQNNLDLARLRFNVGSAGVEEVYRWEAQAARQRSSTIASENRTYQALNALNQAIGFPLTNQWKLADIQMADTDYYFLGQRLTKVIATQADLAMLRDFTAAEAMRNSPTLAALDRAIAAQDLVLHQLRRKGYVPSFGASLVYSHIFDQRFASPPLGDQLAAAGLPVQAVNVDDNEWVASVQASVPLFEGGGRMADVGRAKAVLDQLVATREQARQVTELQARNSVNALQSSQPNIRLSRLAADRSQKNLNVVKDKYASGSVSILSLLDAQNDARVQAQTAAIAVYQYLADLIDFQRGIGWFELLKTDEEKDAWAARFRDYVAAQAKPVRTRSP